MHCMKRCDHISAFVDVLWKWYAENKRVLPWRDIQEPNNTKRAYQVLVSEIMLQQTQVSRVIPLYKNFLDQFPTISTLAVASNAEVIRAWRGMGYNSRALRLRDAARSIETVHNGEFPNTLAELLLIKGIGDYTAAAIRNFAFYLPTPCIDTNIRRILHRTFVGPENSDGTWNKTDTYLLRIAESVLNEAMQNSTYTTADWHAALMDFGSLVCTKRSPKWDMCPLTAKGLCKAAYKVHFEPRKVIRKLEPGREMAGKFVPNRIFRGRIINKLRDAPQGMSAQDIGVHICIDWSTDDHAEWLQGLLQDLEKDQLIHRKKQSYALVD